MSSARTTSYTCVYILSYEAPTSFALHPGSRTLAMSGIKKYEETYKSKDYPQDMRVMEPLLGYFVDDICCNLHVFSLARKRL